MEVPFTELEPEFQRAYKELARQVRLPGFRPGKAPLKLLEARFGRESMLDQVVNEALPARYGQAVAESEVQPIGQPEIEVTKNCLLYTSRKNDHRQERPSRSTPVKSSVEQLTPTRVRISVEAVSYTHLDVYKRQG